MRKLNELYPDTPVILINAHRLVFNKCAEEYLGVKVGSEVIITRRYGIAVLGETSTAKGYKVGKSYGQKLSAYIPESISLNPTGIYKVLEPITIGELDWFNLEKIEDDIPDNKTNSVDSGV